MIQRALLFLLLANIAALGRLQADEPPLRLLVMDPLAAPLSCDCVDGHGQRDYQELAKFLEGKLQRKVLLAFNESLELAYKKERSRFDVVIGQQSVLHYDARRTGTLLHEVLRLTDKNGSTEVAGLFMVRSDEPWQQVTDLVGQTIALGPIENYETNGEPRIRLQDLGLDESCQLKSHPNIDAAVFAVDDGEATATIIPDYLPSLLVGCGKIPAGRLKEIGRTQPVPFVVACLAGDLPPDTAEQLCDALRQVSSNPQLLTALESAKGFVPPALSERSWCDFRGPGRQGHYGHLPTALPAEPRVYWRAKVTGPAMAGISATHQYVIVADKDAEFTRDIFRCFDAATGEQLWTVEYPSRMKMDYTTAPRAAPIIHGDRVFLQGALGELHCVDLATGQVVWSKHLVNDLDGELMTWGYSVPPMIVGDTLIVSPGGESNSICALALETGTTVWKKPGHAAAYSAMIHGTLGGVEQVVGYDVAGLFGRDPRTGDELWRLTPPGAADFNVTSPVVVDGELLLATENNATRRFRFDNSGQLVPKPITSNEDAAPDTSTPAVSGSRAFIAGYGQLFCLDMASELKTVWEVQDDMFYEHTNLVAGNNRILAWTTSCDLLLLSADTDKYEVISHYRPFSSKRTESMAHPAFVGNRIYLRDQHEIVSVQLAEE